MAMAASSLLDSPTSSRNLSPSTKENLEDSADSHFWKSLQRRVKVSNIDNKDLKSFLYRKAADPENVLKQSNSNRSNTSSRATTESRWRKNEDSMALHKGLEAIASSLSLLSETLGTAIEEGLTLAEAKAAAAVENETKPHSPEKAANPQPKEQEELDKNAGLTKDTQLKASRDVAMAMATKAKLLLRELKGVKTDLTYTRNRCAQLEEENKRLRENLDKGDRQEEDDLVRLQLEALLAEKARLAQENAEYARENQFLHEVVQYHQLKLRDVALPDDESLIADDDDIIGEEGIDDSATVDMVDFLPLYPEEKDIIALEDTFRNKKLSF